MVTQHSIAATQQTPIPCSGVFTLDRSRRRMRGTTRLSACVLMEAAWRTVSRITTSRDCQGTSVLSSALGTYRRMASISCGHPIGTECLEAMVGDHLVVHLARIADPICSLLCYLWVHRIAPRPPHPPLCQLLTSSKIGALWPGTNLSRGISWQIV